MKQMRRIFSIVVVLVIIALAFSGCSCGDRSVENENNENIDNTNTFSSDGFFVDYIDVGEGDCIFISLGDGKTMLIDCGDKSERISKKIISHLEKKNVTKIDYLILTHPDSDHVGNAVDIINKFEIGLAYIPYIVNSENLTLYSNAITLINQKNIQTKISSQFEQICGEDYLIMFLSPLPQSMLESSYVTYNLEVEPTKTETNNLSPIIYLSYKGVRFVFTGDACKSQEQVVVEENKLKLYSNKNSKVKLEGIDFLKVSHHGGEDASSSEFLDLISPSNAVISVGGDNYYGHPSTNTLARILLASENCNIYRTDTDGSILVKVNKYAKVKIEKENA